MALKFADGAFRVSCCARGHVTLEVVDGDGAVKFVSVMSRVEAADLASRLVSASVAGRPRSRLRRVRVH